jgi:hypothetical protein
MNGNARLPLVWREHYVVAVIGPTDASAVSRLEDHGFSVVHFEPAEETWAEPLQQLAKALGR